MHFRFGYAKTESGDGTWRGNGGRRGKGVVEEDADEEGEGNGVVDKGEVETGWSRRGTRGGRGERREGEE